MKLSVYRSVMMMSAAVLLTGCSTSGVKMGESQTRGQTESQIDNQTADQTESQADNQTAGQARKAIWFIDSDLDWSETKEQEFSKRLYENYIMLDLPLTFVSISESEYIGKVEEFLKTHDDSLPVYLSTHDEGILKKLQEEGAIESYECLEERNVNEDVTYEGSLVAEKAAIEYFGPYIAMVLPDQSEVNYEEIPGWVVSSTYLTDFVSGPDMSRYVESVDERRFTYKGGSGDWEFEYQVDGSITYYRMDGRLSTDSECNQKLIASFKGDMETLNRVKQMEIVYRSTAKGGSMKEEGPFNRPEFVLSGGGRGGAVEDGEETIHVTVTMDGVEESFELQRDPSV